MAPEQDWCLECGAAVTTRVVRPPGWRAPLIVGLVVLAGLGVALAIAVGSLSDKADRAAGSSATAARSAPVRPTAVPAPRRTTAAPVPGATEASGGGTVPLWPAGRQAYTIVAPSGDGRASAESAARRLIAGGARAGVLPTDGYEFFTPGHWVTWVGSYPDRPAAQARLAGVARRVPGAYITLVRRRGAAGQPTG